LGEGVQNPSPKSTGQKILITWGCDESGIVVQGKPLNPKIIMNCHPSGGRGDGERKKEAALGRNTSTFLPKPL
jgi:hypothetical protein